jgi:peroxiredoxin
MNSITKTGESRIKISISIVVVAVAVSGLYVISGNFEQVVTQEILINRATSTQAALHLRAPALSLMTTTGQKFALDSYIGKPLIIFFWATWNTQSVDQLVVLENLSKNERHGVEFVSVNVQEDASIVESFLKRAGHEMRTLLDEAGSVSNAYHAYALPALYVIDKEGYIINISYGTLSASDISQKIETVVE